MFAGRDASASYVTGDFANDDNDNVESFDAEKFASLLHWREFYQDHKQYKHVGKVIGRFFNAQGEPTELLKRAEALAGQYRAAQAAAEGEKSAAVGTTTENQIILCNIMWEKLSGSQVGCEEGRVPRRVAVHHNDDGGGGSGTSSSSSGSSDETRCMCFDDVQVTASRQLYDGCDLTSRTCHVADDYDVEGDGFEGDHHHDEGEFGGEDGDDDVRRDVG